MTVELLQTLSLAAYIAAGVFVLIGIALFFLLDVPKLYGDVSGRTARKAIENIRLQNESSGNKAYKPSAVNAERGKLTDKITMSGRLESQHTSADMHIHVGTEKFATAILAPQPNETTVLEEPAGETTVLTGELQGSGQTTLLGPDTNNNGEKPVVNGKFNVDVDMSFTGSSEIIE